MEMCEGQWEVYRGRKEIKISEGEPYSGSEGSSSGGGSSLARSE